MLKSGKTQKAVLEKMKIEQLNAMQEAAQLAIHSQENVVILSPTGTGKTLAFLLPLMQLLNPAVDEIQALILVPSRELALQIEQVAREIGSGYTLHALYGGRLIKKDKADLKTNPALVIGTPGRIADHLRRGQMQVDSIKILVLDEFDKSLEVGFEDEMRSIIEALPKNRKNILTSASKSLEIPGFVGLDQAKYINHLHEGVEQLNIKTVLSPKKDKLDTLLETITYLNNQTGIIFCNFKDSIARVSDFLNHHHIPHGCFYGGMEQKERERALIKFRNGTHRLLIATDLAARGIDVPEIQFIIHYHLPLRSVEFTHRNGRTARMHKDGTAYVLQWSGEKLPDFIKPQGVETLNNGSASKTPQTSKWVTLFISGGRKDKISKGDIAGLFFKQAGLQKEELGLIELKQDCAFVAVPRKKSQQLIKQLNARKLKTKKVNIRLV